MYQILCDGFPLYDPRDDELIVGKPKCKLEVNTVGEASFSIYNSHPYYDKLQKMRSVFEIKQDATPIFRGRMTDDTLDFNNTKVIDLEGAMAFFNDSIIKPFDFPNDFLNDAEYNAAASSGNVVEYFLKWLINQHNSRVADFQKFKLGNVTVTDANNYITRSNSEYATTWQTLKEKLFESSLGGYLCIRYEADGNYIDYLADFTETNLQEITYGENLLDLSSESSATETYTAIIPLGAQHNEIDPTNTDISRLTIEEISDYDITSDIVKKGDMLYSKSAVEKYGWIFAPPSETTWSDVKTPENLRINGVEYLSRTALKLANTITIKAVDLHFSDAEIESFRIYKNINVKSKPHAQEGEYKLTQLDIDIQNPQNSVITLGDTQLSMTDINAGMKQSATQQIEKVTTTFSEQLNRDLTVQEKQILKTCEEMYDSKIAQFSKSITLEVSGSLGSKANITLAVNGTRYAEELDLSEIRKAFANDNSIVEISGGKITFSAGTIVINSTNFILTADGVVRATGADVEGTVSSIGGLYKVTLSNGSLKMNYDENTIGEFTFDYYDDTSKCGLAFQAVSDASHIMFRHLADNSYVQDYIINLGLNPNDITQRHIFYGTAYFSDALTANNIYANCIYSDNDDMYLGSYDQQTFLRGSTLYLGSNEYVTYLYGSTVYLKDTNTTVTSDRRAKNSIEELPEEYERFFNELAPVRFRYNNGKSGRYHLGYIAQDVKKALEVAGLSTGDFAGYVDMGKELGLGLMYDEFIALLHMALTRQKGQIDALKGRVDELSDKLERGAIFDDFK